MKEISILGVIVGKEQVQMEQEKIKAVKEWKTPTKIKEVESFLEFTNFYRRFIQNFSHTTRLLNKLKEKRNGYGLKNTVKITERELSFFLFSYSYFHFDFDLFSFFHF